MFPSLRTFAAQAHQPLIRFIGKRQWPPVTETPHPHPAATVEFRGRFADFLKKRQAFRPTPTPTGSMAYDNFWEIPTKYWQPRVREIEETEMEAVMSGGASSYNRG